jgi:hypothetical protein
MRIRWSVLVPLVSCGAAVAALSACGGGHNATTTSTSTTTTSYAQAEHLDSLGSEAATEGYFDRGRLLTYPTAVLAEGVSPKAVTLTVNGASQSYNAVVAEILETEAGSSSRTVTDSAFVVIAWQGTDVSELVYLQVAAPDTINDWAALADTLANENLYSTSTATVSLASSGGACGLLDLATITSLVQGSTCTQATVNTSFNLQFAAETGATDSTFVLATTALPGIRLVLPASTGGLDAIAPRLSARRSQ